MAVLDTVKTDGFEMDYCKFGNGPRTFDTAPDYRKRVVDFFLDDNAG